MASVHRNFISEGHLIDSGILAQILNLIVGEGADYNIRHFHIGKTNLNPSRLEIEVITENEERMELVTRKLVQQGCYEQEAPEARLEAAPKDSCVPEDFYSTTNHRTQVYFQGRWQEVSGQRMDAVIVMEESGPVCKKIRDVRAGDRVVLGADAIRVFPPPRERDMEAFGFMSGEVSSERSVHVAVDRIAEEMKRLTAEDGKIVAVVGPVVIHTGSGPALASLIREGYIHGILAGNALAVHDLESVFFGTSLGVNLQTGKPSNEGHKNHMRSINRIYRYGSIKAAVDAGALDRGVMYELTRGNVSYSLAGSIRDDGPLPETENDMIRAQTAYADIIKGADMVLMLSTMLHSIGTGNMLPSWVKTACVDINPAVVTKLADRGSNQAVGIVSDVGLFVRSLAAELTG